MASSSWRVLPSLACWVGLGLSAAATRLGTPLHVAPTAVAPTPPSLRGGMRRGAAWGAVTSGHRPASSHFFPLHTFIWVAQEGPRSSTPAHPASPLARDPCGGPIGDPSRPGDPSPSTFVQIHLLITFITISRFIPSATAVAPHCGPLPGPSCHTPHGRPSSLSKCQRQSRRRPTLACRWTPVSSVRALTWVPRGPHPGQTRAPVRWRAVPAPAPTPQRHRPQRSCGRGQHLCLLGSPHTARGAPPTPPALPRAPTPEHKSNILRIWRLQRPHHLAFHFSWLAFFAAFVSTFAPAALLPVIRDNLDLVRPGPRGAPSGGP
jgi:hypothetical protein